MKIDKICLLLLSVFLLGACAKDTENVSVESIPYTIELDGDEVVLVEQGQPYVEPGYALFSDTTEVEASAVRVEGYLNTAVPGKYTLRYSAVNGDGIITLVKRTVIVFDPASPTGFYTVSKDSYCNSPPSPEYASEPTVIIYQEESGAYNISDLFGGYYAIGRGYGPDFAASGSVNISRNGALSLVKSSITYWEDVFTSVTGTYNSATKTFEFDVDWESGYTFHLILIKQ